MTDAGDITLWRNLGSYEVLAVDFEAPGEPWDDVFPSEFTEPVPDWLRAELPDAGWREVTNRGRSGPGPDRRMFAAPIDRGWVTALVYPQSEGPPVFMGDISTYQLRPTQEIRRQGLALSWTEPLRVVASESNALTVTLTNTTDAVWTPDPEDHDFVHGHFLDDAGQSPAKCSFGYARQVPGFKGVSLAPGKSMHMPVTFSHDKPPAPGSYGIEAILVSLNLRSPKGTLEVVADSDEAPRTTFSAAQNAERLMQEEYERSIEKLLGENPEDS